MFVIDLRDGWLNPSSILISFRNKTLLRHIYIRFLSGLVSVNKHIKLTVIVHNKLDNSGIRKQDVFFRLWGTTHGYVFLLHD